MQPITAARNALWAVTAVIWLALGRLALAFLRSELDWRYVAQQSRRDAPWIYRLAGVWGGSEGSLLLFAAVTGAVASLAVLGTRRPATAWFATGTVVAFALVDLWWASPFGTLDRPSLRGLGLTPILEHPAMAVHPPLLYTGLACALGAAMASIDGADPRPWLRRSLALVTAAMALGGLWSYVEQGWGGYWAWDPVENTSLLVWLAALIALHAPTRRWLALLPWLLALVGACLVRSGATPSIHGFAEQASVGWALLVVTICSVLALLTLRAPAVSTMVAGSAVPSIAAVAALAVVAAGTFAPVLIDIATARPAVVRGEFFARTVGPVALVTIPFLVGRVRRPPARLAHVGMLVLLLGIAATTFDREQQVGVAAGSTVEAAGLTVRNGGVTVEPAPRKDLRAVVATLEVEGTTMRPSLVAYPERGGVLAETAMVTRPWRDVQVTLLDANDAGFVRIIVRQRPFTWLVWLGAVLTTIGALSSRWSPRARPRHPAEPVSSPAAR